MPRKDTNHYLSDATCAAKGREVAAILTAEPNTLRTLRSLGRQVRVSPSSMTDVCRWMRQNYDNFGVYGAAGVMMTVDQELPKTSVEAVGLANALRLREWLVAHPGEHIYKTDVASMLGIGDYDVAKAYRTLRKLHPDEFQTNKASGAWWEPKEGGYMPPKDTRQRASTNGHKPPSTNGNGHKPTPKPASAEVELLFEDDNVMLLLRDENYVLYRKVAVT